MRRFSSLSVWRHGLLARLIIEKAYNKKNIQVFLVFLNHLTIRKVIGEGWMANFPILFVMDKYFYSPNDYFLIWLYTIFFSFFCLAQTTKSPICDHNKARDFWSKIWNDEKCAFFDQNAWTIAHWNDEKCAIFDQNAWPISHWNDEKCAIFDQNA